MKIVDSIQSEVVVEETMEVESNVVSLCEAKERFKRCNICNNKYYPRSKFQRFCKSCRTKNELYHFSEWMTA